jgi:hypothetical protein
MYKKMAGLALLLVSLLALSGCAPLSNLLGIGGGKTEEEPLTNGTTTGNILNGGFAVKDGDELLFYYTGGSVYPKGTLVRSNPDTKENIAVMDNAGLYMNLVDGTLYYCLDDGIYTAKLDAPQPQRVLEGECSLLQISGGHMYFVRNSTIESAALDGSPLAFTPIDNAACLNVYGSRLYYSDTANGHIRRAEMDGTGDQELFDQSVDLFCIIDDVIYYIDSADGLLKRMALEIDPESIETLTEKRCSGFNINRSGLYYTLDDGLCYNAGADGAQAQAISDFGTSAWHRACLFGEGALVVRQEDLPS